MEGLSLLTHLTHEPPAMHMCQCCPLMVPKQDSNVEWASFVRFNKSCMRMRLRWDEIRDDLSHSFSYQSRWVLWGSIRAADTPGCRAVPWKGIYSPMPRRVSRNFSTSTGNRILLVLYERLSLILFRAQQCGSFTAAEADSHWGWSQVSQPTAWRAVAQLHSEHADHMMPRWCIIAFI